MLSALAATLVFTANAQANVVGPMSAVEINGFQLTGAEYWPFISNEPFRYPSDVLWGFYPDGATQNAVDCAEKSYEVLMVFFRDNLQLLRDVVAQGATRKFYLWVNDYTSAAADREARTARMWHWNSGARDYTSGYWKWETTLTPHGDCSVPKPAQIRAALLDALNNLSGE